ncbi:ROK family protein [Spiroplasma eriocheiris]|uniref:Glucokinase n=1 Tax=Spiroplasma eriocheiris TaxID=315358 RepID=A0A0H3XGU1_9MOLU|nr:ROK family protein [Spiroplasma eriocheiris]AHF57243.1 putative glucokinase [Spiroplasma eriocheiris CCTCC M 207170]AKM53708.1 glucokinase [Spiroplasma eriocheiris]
MITLAGNLGWKNFNIRSEAAAIFNKEIYIINDANAAALGEYWCGDHGDKATLALYTLGTGIGGGLILNGNLWTGTTGYAGEFGHGGHFQDKYPCTCGLRHCIEPVSSATGLTKLLNEQANQNPESSLGKLKAKLGHHLKLLNIKELFDQKDPLTITTITEGLIPLANHIAIMLYILNPQAIILAGGVTNLGGNLAEIINELVKERVGDFVLPTFKIEISKLQAKAGMYGTAYYAFKNSGLL